MDIVQKSFGLNLTVLRMLGMFPVQFSRCYTLYTYFIYAIMIVPIPLLVTINFLLKDNVDLVLISDNAFLVCQMACKITKLLPFIRESDKVRKCIDTLKLPIFRQYNKNQKKSMDLCITTCKRNGFLFLIFVIGSIATWAVRPFVRGDYTLPLDIWVPVNLKEQSELYYCVLYTYIVLGVTAGGLTSAAIDPLVAGLAYHATTQLKILKNNLEFLDEEKQNFEMNNNSQRQTSADMKLKIQHCIIHHVAILDFITSFEDVYSNVVFSQFFASVFVICMCCFCLIIVEPFSVIFFSMLVFLVTMLGEIFLYCYYGTLLFEENNTLTTAVYMGNWYTYDIPSRRALLILTERSKKPVIVTAGKVLDLSLETFTMILRRAYSLLAVLKNY